MTPEFFESYGLYRKLYDPEFGSQQPEHVSYPPIQLYCPICEMERTWNVIGGKERRHRPSVPTVLGQFPDASLNRTSEITYFCDGCMRSRQQFFFYHGLESADGRQSLSLDEMLRQGTRRFIMKVGQHPPGSTRLSAEVRRAIGSHEDTYVKGRQCELHSFGIGAYGYYRRIVESIIDALLRDIIAIMPEEDRAKYGAELAALASSKNAQDKINIVMEHLPPVLQIGGLNPLAILHNALSVGIHHEPDEVCLEWAEAIRTALERLITVLETEKQSARDTAASLKAVTEKLAKRQAKGLATGPAVVAPTPPPAK
jgi:hypothetical protein